MRTRQATWYTGRGYVGVDLLPYQAAVGVSLRWLRGPHLRLYAGPVKFYAGAAERQ